MSIRTWSKAPSSTPRTPSSPELNADRKSNLRAIAALTAGAVVLSGAGYLGNLIRGWNDHRHYNTALFDQSRGLQNTINEQAAQINRNNNESLVRANVALMLGRMQIVHVKVTDIHVAEDLSASVDLPGTGSLNGNPKTHCVLPLQVQFNADHLPTALETTASFAGHSTPLVFTNRAEVFRAEAGHCA